MDAVTPVRLAVWKELVIGAVAVFTPAFALARAVEFAPLPGEYNGNAWIVGYFGNHFRQHGSFPETLSTGEHVGLGVPLFYGFVGFKILGGLSALFGCHLAIRLVVVGCLLAVYTSIRWAARRFGADPALAVVGACCTTWATYSLTNLYNRFAFAEFIAGSMLVCACCFWLVLLLRPRPTGSWYTSLTGGLFLALAAGTHPITGMLSVPAFAAAYALHWFAPVPERPGLLRRHFVLLLAAVPLVLVMAPWLIAYAALGNRLMIQDTTGINYLDLTSWTAVAVRLFPLPADYNLLTPGAMQLGVQHLDTQINVPLLCLGLAVLGSLARSLSGWQRAQLAVVLLAPAFLGFAAFVISVWPDSRDLTPKVLGKIQFAYRLVGLVNIALVIGFLTLLAFRSATGGMRPLPGVPPMYLTVIVTLAACGMLVKVTHGRAAVMQHELPVDPADPAYEAWLRSAAFLATADYLTPFDTPQVTIGEARRYPLAAFPVGGGEQFGQVQPVTVQTRHDGYVRTNAVPFRWATLRVDGQPVPRAHWRVWWRPTALPKPTGGLRLAVPVPAGTHTIEYEFTPPRVWRVAGAVSNGTLAAWIVLVVAVPVGRFLRPARNEQAPTALVVTARLTRRVRITLPRRSRRTCRSR